MDSSNFHFFFGEILRGLDLLMKIKTFRTGQKISKNKRKFALYWFKTSSFEGNDEIGTLRFARIGE